MAEVELNCSVQDCVVNLRRSSRSDLVSALSVLVSFPLAFWGLEVLAGGISPDFAASLALLILSIVTASILAARANWNEIPMKLQPACATRWGARIGLVVFLTGGGAFLLGGMCRQLNPDTHGAGSLIRSVFSTGVTGIAFSVLPTIAAGCLASLSRLRAGMMAGSPIPVSSAEIPPIGNRRTPITFAVLFFALCLISLGLPAYLESRRMDSADRLLDETNRRSELLSRQEARSAPAEPANTPPPVAAEFNYEPPSGLDEAPAVQLSVIATRQIPGLSSGTVAEYSRDSRFLAFVGQGDNSTTIFDVRKSKVVRQFPPLPRVSAITWSPQGERLFYFGEGNSCRILDPASGAVISLPVRRPLNDWTPKWELQNEIEFYRGRIRVATLDLTTLLVKYHQVPTADLRNESKTPVTKSLAETKRWSLTIRLRLSTLESPLESSSNSWLFGSEALIYVSDKESGRHFPLLSSPFDPRTTVLVSPDSSMITIVSANGAHTHYLGISDAKEADVTASESPPFSKIGKSSRLAELIDSGGIGTFICAPLINPLTNRVVGADANQVRALTVFGNDPEHRTLAIVETYFPIQPGDVAGYLHQWQAREPLLLAGRKAEDWWSPVSLIAKAQKSPVPSNERWQDPYLEVTPCGIELKGWSDSSEEKAESKVASIILLNAGQKDAPAEPAAPVAENEVLEVRAFVQAHHAKVGMHDLEGFVSDYAPTVDFNDKGTVTADFIRQDQAAYLPKYDNISEAILGDIAVGRNGNVWRAVYNLRSYALKRADKKEFDRRVSIVLDLMLSEEGSFKIVRERAMVGN